MMVSSSFGRVSSLKWWQGHFLGLQSCLQSDLVRGFDWCQYLFDCSFYYLYGYVGQGILCLTRCMKLKSPSHAPITSQRQNHLHSRLTALPPTIPCPTVTIIPTYILPIPILTVAGSKCYECPCGSRASHHFDAAPWAVLPRGRTGRVERADDAWPQASRG